MTDKADITTHNPDSEPVASTATATATAPPAAATTAAGDDDSDPDFDDLDDVLDQFSANAPSQAAASAQSSSSQPHPIKPPTDPSHREPKDSNTDLLHLTDQPLPNGPKPGESEEDFVNRLSAEMAKLFSNLPSDADVSAQSPGDMAKMGKELEEFTRQMEEQGVKPEDLLKAILGEEEGGKIVKVAGEERERRESGTQEQQTAKDTATKASAGGSGSGSGSGSASFENTIRQTMSRLNESDTQAKSASQQSAATSEEDMLAEMLKALDGSGGGGPDGTGSADGISKMFLDMMHQLTQKDMLYEPMKELHEQYPAWLSANAPPKTKKADFERYTKQSVIVKEITAKFEEPGYRDEEEGCRTYIWEKMQEMQGLGAPPEELVKNPLPGTDFGSMGMGIPGLGGGGGEEGCPTQ